MPTKIVWPEFDPYLFSNFYNHLSCPCIGYRESSLIRPNVFGPHIIQESLAQFLRNKHNLLLSATFWGVKQKLLVINVCWLETKYLADSSHPLP